MAEKRVLIIDDDAELNAELADLLEAEGYPADSAADGPAGLALIRKNDYGIFLLDYKMKDLTGVDLLREIRQKSPAAAIFMISGRPEIAAVLEKEAVSGAVAGVIEKPFDPRVLLKKLRACR